METTHLKAGGNIQQMFCLKAHEKFPKENTGLVDSLELQIQNFQIYLMLFWYQLGRQRAVHKLCNAKRRVRVLP